MSLACNFPSKLKDASPPSNFQVFIVPDPDSILAHVSEIFQQYFPFIDRFVFLYSESDSHILKQIFRDELISAEEHLKKEILYPVFFADDPVKDTINDLPHGFFTLVDFQDRIIQVLGFSVDQFLDYFVNRSLDDLSTCLILFNLDRLCFQLRFLSQIYSDLLLKFSKWCRFFAFSHNPQSLPFYYWLAHTLDKAVVVHNQVETNVLQRPNRWTLLTLGESPLDFLPDDSLPSKFSTELIKIYQEIPGFEVLLSPAPFVQKSIFIHKINQSKSIKTYWHNFRRFALVLLIASRLPYKEKLLIITESFDQKNWVEFQQEWDFPKFDVEFRPVLASINIIAQLTPSSLNRFDRVILDLGDDLSSPLFSSRTLLLLGQVILANSVIQSIPVTFFHPLLLSKSTIEWILTNPLTPWHLTVLSDPDHFRQELIFLAILLTTQKRHRKVDFYNYLRSSWFLSDLDTEMIPFAKYVKLLRHIGLLDRQHFQTTPLGTFFLTKELLVNSFLNYLQERLPDLFNQNLAKKMPRSLFLQFYFLCAEWFFHEKKETDYNEAEWLTFIEAVSASCRIWQLPEEIQLKAIELVTHLVAQKLKNIEGFSSERIITLSEQSIQAIKGREIQPGKALRWAIRDILFWMNSLKTQDSLLPQNPFFQIRKQAQIRAAEGISESSYFRAINRIFQKNLSERAKKYFIRIESPVPHFQVMVFTAVVFLRKTLEIRNIKLTNNRGSQVLVFKEPIARKWRTKITRRSNFEFLDKSCGECIHFASRRKKHCYLFNQLIEEDDIPSVCKNRVDPYAPVFSSMVGCPLWRPQGPVQRRKGESLPTYCLHCYQLLRKRKRKDKFTCQCGTEYQLIRHNDTNQVQGFEYRLTAQHSIEQDLALLFPGYEVEIQVESTSSDLMLQQFTPETENEFLQLKDSPQYVFIKDTDVLGYDSALDRLEITDKNGLTRNIDLMSIALIDTQQMPEILQEIIQDYSSLKFNYRPYRLTLSNDDDYARIVRNNHQIPLLEVKRYRKKDPEKYYLHHIASVFNVGKPRLNDFFKQYAIDSIYSSTKGIHTHPLEEIPNALDFDGVRTVLSDIHLLGLTISAIRATAHLIGLLHYYDQPELGERVFLQMKRLLLRSPVQIYNLYTSPTNLNDSILKKRSRFEGWIFRPFAEGIRAFVSTIDDMNPLLSPKDGRNVSRRVWKHPKEWIDYMGAYSPFDSALNVMNRRLRYQLRLWNAKAGFGFKTVPLFSHQATDKPGRSGHLDLEEVGRIITRFVLLDEIVSGNLRKKDFQPRFDNNNLIYYVPWQWQLGRIRNNLVNRKIFQMELHYNDQWLPFEKAHQSHVNHLRHCLKECIGKKSPISFLLKSYTPMIFHIRLFDHKTSEIQSNLFYLFKYCWIERTNKLWDQLKVDPDSPSRYLTNPHLVERLLMI